MGPTRQTRSGAEECRDAGSAAGWAGAWQAPWAWWRGRDLAHWRITRLLARLGGEVSSNELVPREEWCRCICGGGHVGVCGPSLREYGADDNAPADGCRNMCTYVHVLGAWACIASGFHEAAGPTKCGRECTDREGPARPGETPSLSVAALCLEAGRDHTANERRLPCHCCPDPSALISYGEASHWQGRSVPSWPRAIAAWRHTRMPACARSGPSRDHRANRSPVS